MSAPVQVATPARVPGVRVECVVTSGTFSLDGGTWEVDNNVYVVGDDRECLIVDAAHDAEAILAAVAGRAVVAVALTHGHDDHIDVAERLREATGAPLLLHGEDAFFFERLYPTPPDGVLADGQVLEVAGVPLTVLHTPGHTPGGCCLHAPTLAVVFSGDTLFQGGPGATGRSFSDFDTIIGSIREKLLTLPSETMVLTGHGDATTIADEAPHLQEWIARGH